MATEKNLKKLTIHKLKKKTYNALAEKPVDELVMLTDVGGQVAEITEASVDYVGEIVQYVGETNDTYTNGYFYKCVETDGVYSWAQVNVQEGGGASLPDQTGNKGKFLMTDGTTVSWGKALVNKSTRYPDSTMIIGGEEISAMASGCVLLSGPMGKVTSGATAIGVQAQALGANSVAIGRYAKTNSNCIQLDCSGNTVSNDDANTFKVANANGNFEIMSAEGTIPTDRYTTTPTTAGTYVPKLTIAEDGTTTRVWGAESGGASGDYLPLNGGTLTGALKINPEVEGTFGTVMTLSYGDNDTVIKKSRYDNVLRLDGTTISVAGITPANTNAQIGLASSGFKSIFVSQISGSTSYGDLHYLTVPNKDGTIATVEDINNIVETLPTADNGYTTVKNFGNNYIEASGIYEFGALGANEEVVDVIPLPEGVQFAEGQMYWASAHVTTEDSNANAVVAHITSRTATDLTIVYKNLGTTEVENLFICWEVRGVVAPK